MADRTCVEIEGLMLRARHGVAEVERRVGNDFRLDIRLYYDAAAAMRSDDVDCAVNYAAVIGIAREVMDTPSLLLENVVGRLRDAILAAMPAVTGGRIRLAKLCPPVSAVLDSCAFVLEW
ncbi:MAG: dihydroneopterin aldolase [Muribaculaceae bacterium]|nr:dihydroneopterin aldolase [Muribaculaceae bacterium]